MCYHISYMIERICKKLGIDYKSPHLQNNIDIMKDAWRLQEIYVELHIILGDLEDIAERHQIDGLGMMLQQEIALIEQCDHDINRIAKMMNERKERRRDEKNNQS
ncbi:MAG: hypothetical protein ACTSPD_10325 [Promethearchaeota archaeon]